MILNINIETMNIHLNGMIVNCFSTGTGGRDELLEHRIRATPLIVGMGGCECQRPRERTEPRSVTLNYAFGHGIRDPQFEIMRIEASGTDRAGGWWGQDSGGDACFNRSSSAFWL